MAPIVLLADDSVTIQKVIKITLANELYEIVETPAEDQLIQKVGELQPHLVLLDFSLSPTKSGYDLTKAIKEKSPKTAVLIMFGTFDPIDEGAIKRCGADEKIVKPFDSTKFVNICRSILSSAVTSDFPVETSGNSEILDPSHEPVTAEAAKADEDSDWVVKPTAPASPRVLPQNVHLLPTKDAVANRNPLEAELEDWGMSVPPVIGNSGKSASRTDIPNIIEQEKLKELKEHFNKAPVGTRPAEIFLEDPLNDQSSNIQEIKLTSKLIPLSELKTAPDQSDKSSEKTGEFVVDEVLQKEILPDSKPDDLWRADTDEEAKQVFSNDLLFEEIKDTRPANDFFAPGPGAEVKTVAASTPTVDMAELEKKIRQEMRPIIEKLVREICQETVEKVAWEVIPDLAENLIRSEIGRISDAVISE